MKTTIRRRIIYTSFHMNADFLAYYRGDKLVSLVVDGSSLSVNGEVDVETFKSLLKEIYTADKARKDIWAGKTIAPYREGNHFSHEAVLPHANMREVLKTAYGQYQNRWW